MIYGMTKEEFNRAVYGFDEVDEPNFYVDEDDGYVPDWIEDGYDPFGVADTADWYCLVCGSGCKGDVCWNCGYNRNGSSYDDFDDYFDYDYDDVWDDDFGYALDWD